MDFTDQEITYDIFSTVLGSILDFIHSLLTRMYGFSQVSIVIMNLTTNIGFCTRINTFMSMRMDKDF